MKQTLFAAILVLAGVLVPATTTQAASAPSCPQPPPLPDQFGAGIDNPYLPLTQGKTWVYKGKLDGESATDIFTVTNQTKVILGVTTMVVHDQVVIKGDLVEDTLDWFAQDAAGNVWYFRRGHQGAGSRSGGVDRGVVGGRCRQCPGRIFMPATPHVGDINKQEDAKNVAEDCSRIADLNASVKTRYVSSDEALKTEEFSLLEPDVLDNKYYVPAIGLVRGRRSRAAPTSSSSSR